VGRIGKPEGYYFPLQLNNHLGTFPHTYFGLSPETAVEQVRDLLLQYESRDNRITTLNEKNPQSSDYWCNFEKFESQSPEVFDAESMNAQVITTNPGNPNEPLVQIDVADAQGNPVRLIDFSSAGKNDTYYSAFR